MATRRVRPVILVGTDGSAGSIWALRWALRQAHATGGEVRAVLAWENSGPLGVVATVDDVDWRGIATAAVQESWSGASTHGQPSPHWWPPDPASPAFATAANEPTAGPDCAGYPEL